VAGLGLPVAQATVSFSATRLKYLPRHSLTGGEWCATVGGKDGFSPQAGNAATLLFWSGYSPRTGRLFFDNLIGISSRFLVQSSKLNRLGRENRFFGSVFSVAVRFGSV
jgi:hypothetical protein